MMAALISGILLGLTVGVAPGPLLALVVSQTLTYGAKEGAKVAVAPLISDLPIVAVAFWIVLRLKSAPWAPALLSLAGGVYIVYLVRGNLQTRQGAQTAAATAPRSMKKGALVNLLNPHPYMFWMTVGAPLMAASWVSSPATSIFWMAGFYGGLVGAMQGIAFIAGRTRAFLSSRAYLWLNRILALVLLFFAGLLIKNGIGILRGFFASA